MSLLDLPIPPHFPLDRLARALRADGVDCTIRPGAQGKSARNFATRGYYMGCRAVVQHHTVSSGANPINDITYIEQGKGIGYVIANAYTALDGTVYLIASGPTYTEGTGGPLGTIPENRGNDVSFSNEIASWGAVDSVYPQVQQDAVASLAFHAGLIAAEVWGWSDDPFAPHRAFAHFEWAPGRKVDPRGVSRWSPAGGMWDMAAFRAELTARNTPEPPTEDDDMPGPEYILKPPPGTPIGWPWLYVRGAAVRPATADDVKYAQANGIAVGHDPDASQAAIRYRNLHVAAMSGREPGQ